MRLLLVGDLVAQRADIRNLDLQHVARLHPHRRVLLGADAILYTVSDSALLRSIGQYRTQGKDKAGKVIQLVE